MTKQSTLSLKPGVAVRKAVNRQGQPKPFIPAKAPSDLPAGGDRRFLRPALDHLDASPAWRERKPLAVGFHKAAIVAAPDGLTAKLIRQAIGTRCRSVAYRRRLAQGGERYAWDGSPAGRISPEDQRSAERSLEKKRKIGPHRSGRTPHPGSEEGS